MLLAKCHSLGKSLEKKIFWKKFSVQVKSELADNSTIPNLTDKISHNFLIPSLPHKRLKQVNEITGITIKKGQMGWARISSQTLEVFEWNFKSKPEDYKNLNEASILKLACNLKEIIPFSDLFVMEKIGTREGSQNLNDIRLSSMLMVFLNNFKNGDQEYDKVIFQKENVMNILHNLLIGSERVSARLVFEKMLNEVNEVGKSNISKTHSAILYSLTRINSENFKFYDKSSLGQQECLSFVLLLTLSFIDVFIYQNIESLSKIQMQSKLRKIQRRT